MSAMYEPSDDELRTNALNDPGLFLDIEDDDEDVVLSAGLPTPAVVLQRQQQQQQQNATSPTAGGQVNGVPKLDVTALTSFPVDSNQHPIAGFMAPAASNSPISFSRELGVDHTTGNVYLMGAAPSSSPASSPQNTSQSFSSLNVYASIANPPLCARSLPFRDFLNQKSVPPHIENEESTGIFVGQLPSSYAEDDIEALLKAIGHERGKIVQVRDVKCHNRDRTCAFIMINASALAAILEFTKRVLCDINCVWIVEHNQAAQLPLFIQQMPREQLRGVPKAALVLEKLTPQSKSRHSNHKSNVATSPNTGYTAIQTRMLSPMQHSVPGVSMLSHPVFLQQQGVGASPTAAAGGHLDVSALQATSPFGGSNYLQAANVNGLPQLFGSSRFQPGAPMGTFFAPGGVTPCSNSVYTMQLSNSGIANIEVANQMMLAASRSCGEFPNYQLNMFPTSPSSKEASAPPPKPTTVTLQPALQSEHCSCGQMLLLSQYPEQGTCAKCQCVILPNDVAYWCVSGHIAVCANCAIKSNRPQSGQNMTGRRMSADTKSQRTDAGLANRAIN
ncbi:conserved hypothetical protein [Leishmania infantum JPCM5]|uniref:Uncharacterized protein n=2 Tax=Leishmania infantum TaxID=5671 RepID=A4I7R4_LEIIN|nr:conserved hypothetical protein [Leishmania infantum JPCM5]CAC9524002.1 hypothetical_protein_-_conserved [Leishmania infantum]CAM70850.1 conserved hypothetical protein [Leishmania infantum JPCM5]SUZ44668.1 hypothetical_protein_-_conserved [Leishmania infantum]|eukprot:XP_001467783.1 conserved hypothetical protein [Leishmania infantum JPCM5]